MSQIKSKNAKPEIIIKKLIWKKGYKYRIGHGLIGKPDMVFSFCRVVVFIDGCFWHSCPEHCRIPLSNVAYWKQKISSNKKRDRRINSQLKKEGWRVIRVWEHDVKNNLTKAVECILKGIQS